MCINEGNISDDETLEKCHKEIALLEYLLENSEYDSMIVEKGVHYGEQEKEDIIRTDGMEERLVDSLMNSFESSNQHTDVLIEEERSERHIEVLPKEEEVQKPYIFDFDDCLMNADFVAKTGTYLAQVDSQMKEQEKEHLLKDVKEDLAEEEEPSNDWSIANEEMGNCIKFPNFTPSKIFELYRELDLQRRKLEQQRINI